MEVEFVVTIPIRQEDAQNVIDAFVNKHPYNAPVPADTVLDNAGNVIPNPITKENYVEDCVAFFILDVVQNYLVRKAAKEARENADIAALSSQYQAGKDAEAMAYGNIIQGAGEIAEKVVTEEGQERRQAWRDFKSANPNANRGDFMNSYRVKNRYGIGAIPNLPSNTN